MSHIRIIYPALEKEREEFALRAANYFSSHPDKNSYTDGDVEMDEYFALRWNRESVLVFKISCDMEPSVYSDIINKAEKA